MLEARPMELTDRALTECSALMHLVFPHATHYSTAYLRWHYCENPLGNVVASNVYDDDVLVMHCAMQPVPVIMDGRAEKALAILNIATHPGFRQRGLLKLGGDHAFGSAREMGYDQAFGIANAHSVSPFQKYWDGLLVGTLTAKIGWGKIPETQADYPFRYRHDWRGDSLSWRLKRPHSVYRQCRVHSKTHIYAPTGKGPWVQMGVTEEPLDLPELAGWARINPFKLWLGFDTSRQWSRFYVDIPMRLRPAPLNFLFFDLTGQDRQLQQSEVLLSPLDFDAY